MDRESVDYWCEKGILGVVLAMLAVAVLAFGAVGNAAWLVVQSLACGLLALWVVRLWARRNNRMLLPPICWAVILFLGYAFFTAGRAPVAYDARAELLRVLVYALVFLAVLQNLHGQEQLQRVAYGLIFLGMTVSIYAVYQFITDSPFVWLVKKPASYLHRGSGTYICPNHLAGFLEMVLPLSIACVVSGRGKHMLKVFLAYAGLAMMAGIGVTVSRGGWIAAGASLAFLILLLLLRNRTMRLPVLAVLALLLGSGWLFYTKGFQAQKRFTELAEPAKNTNARTRIWPAAAAVWKDHFWEGAGPGQFDHAFRKHRPHDIQMRPLYVHNDYLNTLADYGTAGASILAAVMGLFFWSVFRIGKFVQRTNDIAAKPSNRLALVLGGATGITAILIHSVVDFNMHIPANALVAVVLMAVVTAHVRFATERFWVNPHWFGRGILTLALGAAFVFLGMEALSGARHEWFRHRARKAADVAAKIENLESALEADPSDYEASSELGETLRLWAWRGEPGYDKLTARAMRAFDLAMKANPLDPYNYARYGMCLHWLDRHAEAAPWFDRALERDPNNYTIVGLKGWHEFQLERYDEAKKWFERSRDLALRRFDIPMPDEMSWHYLRWIEKKLQEKPQ